MTSQTAADARARLSAYVAHESDADQIEFEQAVDTAVAEAVEQLRQERRADHRTWQHDLGTLRAVQEENGRLREENAAFKKRLHEAAMARVWTNGDGKKFVFADDLKGPLLGCESDNAT